MAKEVKIKFGFNVLVKNPSANAGDVYKWLLTQDKEIAEKFKAKQNGALESQLAEFKKNNEV